MSAPLSGMGCDIVTGGGPGLMQAANEGAQAAQAPERVQSIGIRVELPFEQEVNPFVEQAIALIRTHLARWQAAQAKEA